MDGEPELLAQSETEMLTVVEGKFRVKVEVGLVEGDSLVVTEPDEVVTEDEEYELEAEKVEDTVELGVAEREPVAEKLLSAVVLV